MTFTFAASALFALGALAIVIFGVRHSAEAEAEAEDDVSVSFEAEVGAAA